MIAPMICSCLENISIPHNITVVPQKSRVIILNSIVTMCDSSVTMCDSSVTIVVSHIYTYDRAQNILNSVQQLQKLIL